MYFCKKNGFISNLRNMKKCLYVIGHLLFWIIMCYVFTHYSFLRPIAKDAMYKEYWSVLFIAIMVYINYFYLIPRFFETGKFKIYWPLALLSIILVVGCEFFLVYPDVMHFYSLTLPQEDVNNALRTAFISIIVRDFCFFLFFFILKLYRDLLGNYIRLQKRYSEDTDTIDITAITPNNYRDVRNVDISNIVYITQNRNYSYFHLVDGEILKQYSTMTSLEEILPRFFVKINKSQLININQVVDFKDDKVKMNFKENGKYLSLPVTKDIDDDTFSLLNENAGRFFNNQAGDKKERGIKTWNNEALNSNIAQETPEIDPISDQELLKNAQNLTPPKLYPTIEKTLTFIKEHPHCRVPDISEGVAQSYRAIEDQIKILKNHGLIEYRGSKRTGGYYAEEEVL